jgi:hypothetical protein
MTPTPAPPNVAVQLGHTLEWNPPHALTSARRWTCKTCGAAVLDYHGNVYGSAVENTCEEYAETMRPLTGRG